MLTGFGRCFCAEECVGGKMCEECGLKGAGFGLPNDRKRLWCGPCGKPKGAIHLGSKMCEDCGNATAHYGMSSDHKRLWCSVCSKQHPGSELLSKAQMCQQCKNKRAHYGTNGPPLLANCTAKRR